MGVPSLTSLLETDRLSCSGEAVTIKIDPFHRLSYLNNTQDTVVCLVFFNDSVLGTIFFCRCLLFVTY